jgi:hypothetical protein
MSADAAPLSLLGGSVPGVMAVGVVAAITGILFGADLVDLLHGSAYGAAVAPMGPHAAASPKRQSRPQLRRLYSACTRRRRF